MPTTRSRYQVTETDEVARALDAAAHAWPDQPRSRLLVSLALEGGRALAAQPVPRGAARRRALADLAGFATGAYEPGYLGALREDWPG